MYMSEVGCFVEKFGILKILLSNRNKHFYTTATQFVFSPLVRCSESGNGKEVTPCSLALLGIQMGEALRKMTQNGAQLLLVSIRQSPRAVCDTVIRDTPTVHYPPPLIIRSTLNY